MPHGMLGRDLFEQQKLPGHTGNGRKWKDLRCPGLKPGCGGCQNREEKNRLSICTLRFVCESTSTQKLSGSKPDMHIKTLVKSADFLTPNLDLKLFSTTERETAMDWVENEQ